MPTLEEDEERQFKEDPNVEEETSGSFLELPVVLDSTPVGEALDQAKRHNATAVLRDDGTSFWLSTTRDLQTVANRDRFVPLHNMPAVRLSELGPRQPAIRVFHADSLAYVVQQSDAASFDSPSYQASAEGYVAILAMPDDLFDLNRIVRRQWRCPVDGESYDLSGKCPTHRRDLVEA
ncbi:hypothetical protein NKI01_28950 [Mesorhizobium sp. M0815]|uniref:hypothetical protein n=1 Tax=Mesorhizobium sp. M0815 TaxID=2957005 RepID=UPI003336DFAC